VNSMQQPASQFGGCLIGGSLRGQRVGQIDTFFILYEAVLSAKVKVVTRHLDLRHLRLDHSALISRPAKRMQETTSSLLPVVGRTNA
jgi:hypothetical protein